MKTKRYLRAGLVVKRCQIPVTGFGLWRRRGWIEQPPAEICSYPNFFVFSGEGFIPSLTRVGVRLLGDRGYYTHAGMILSPATVLDSSIGGVKQRPFNDYLNYGEVAILRPLPRFTEDIPDYPVRREVAFQTLLDYCRKLRPDYDYLTYFTFGWLRIRGRFVCSEFVLAALDLLLRWSAVWDIWHIGLATPDDLVSSEVSELLWTNRPKGFASRVWGL